MSATVSFSRLLPDGLYLRYKFYKHFRRRLNLARPVTFNEKIQWMKLHDRNPLLPRCADKWEVRRYVRDRCGDGILNEAYGIYDRIEALDVPALPGQFVIRATHASGWNLICKDKNRVDWAGSGRQMARWLKSSYGKARREWAYYDIPPRLVCEKYLEGADGQPPWDYKFFCFDGVPRAIQVDVDRFRGHTRGLYDPQWNPLPCTLEIPSHDGPIPAPAKLADMLAIARSLAAGLPFVRVDMFAWRTKIIFGEMTFYPGAGHQRFTPASYDELFGSWLTLPRQAG